MDRWRFRIAVGVTALCVATVLAAVVLRRQAREAPPSQTSSTERGRDAGAAADARTAGSASDDRRPGLPPDVAGGHATGDDDPATGDPFAARAKDEPNPWASVDLEEVRAALPDNVYWKMSAPTKDPNVIREREEERERWNVEWGKVLSNTATEDEIAAYYAQRERVSSDYVQFATYLLKNYGKNLSQRDIGLLKVAVELHLARLEEIPRRMAEATERAKAHEAARQAWLADQAKFEGRRP